VREQSRERERRAEREQRYSRAERESRAERDHCRAEIEREQREESKIGSGETKGSTPSERGGTTTTELTPK
jgi:hypothetical protein